MWIHDRNQIQTITSKVSLHTPLGSRTQSKFEVVWCTSTVPPSTDTQVLEGRSKHATIMSSLIRSYLTTTAKFRYRFGKLVSTNTNNAPRGSRAWKTDLASRVDAECASFARYCRHLRVFHQDKHAPSTHLMATMLGLV
jgi:hypothetical protein